MRGADFELRICRGRRIMHIGTLGFTANKRSGRIIGLREAVMREPDGARLSLLTGKRVHRRKNEKKSRQSGEEPKSKTAARKGQSRKQLAREYRHTAAIKRPLRARISPCAACKNEGEACRNELCGYSFRRRSGNSCADARRK